MNEKIIKTKKLRAIRELLCLVFAIGPSVAGGVAAFRGLETSPGFGCWGAGAGVGVGDGVGCWDSSKGIGTFFTCNKKKKKRGKMWISRY